MYHRIVLPVRSAGGRENVSCSIAFLTMVSTIPMESILVHLVGIFLDWFQNKIRYVEMVCSKTVSEQTF